MTVGLPGSGIGGLFYLFSALCMPLAAVARRLRSREGSWRPVWRQWLLALGIVVGLGVTAWLLGVTLARTPMAAWAAQGAADAGRIPDVLRAASVAVALGTLALVVLGVWVAAFLVHGRRAFHPAPPRSETPSQAGGGGIARASSDR
jgi:hypothetical protein